MVSGLGGRSAGINTGSDAENTGFAACLPMKGQDILKNLASCETAAEKAIHVYLTYNDL